MKNFTTMAAAICMMAGSITGPSWVRSYEQAAERQHSAAVREREAQTAEAMRDFRIAQRGSVIPPQRAKPRRNLNGKMVHIDFVDGVFTYRDPETDQRWWFFQTDEAKAAHLKTMGAHCSELDRDRRRLRSVEDPSSEYAPRLDPKAPMFGELQIRKGSVGRLYIGPDATATIHRNISESEAIVDIEGYHFWIRGISFRYRLEGSTIDLGQADSRWKLNPDTMVWRCDGRRSHATSPEMMPVLTSVPAWEFYSSL